MCGEPTRSRVGPTSGRAVSNSSATVATLPPAPAWGYTGTRGEIYVVGGAPYLLDMFTKVILGAPTQLIPLLVARSKVYSETVTPYVARINPQTMQVEILNLTGGTTVNYVGGILVHSNGYIYAVARSVLYKIDPTSFTVVKQMVLPPLPKSSGGDNEETAYNGLVATKNGDLILKGWASTGGGESAPGFLLRIDPKDLATQAKLDTTVITSARMTVVRTRGHEYIYMPGKTQSLRFLVEQKRFALDNAFSRTYLTETTDPEHQQTQASSDMYMGDGVVFADNTVPTATSPMQLFAQATAGSGSQLSKTQALTGGNASWNFFMAAGDPYKSGIVAVGDQVSGHVAGYLACAGGETVQPLWENDEITVSAGVAIDYKRGVLYTDDRSCALAQPCKLFLVALDLRTGNELARVRVAGTKPSIGQIFIGADNAVYYPATDTGEANGYVTRVIAR